ncbi:unnamed protein product [Bursaphelenchus okinawaensis]|uniref:CHMP7 winged helix domain-containing protein n=1 Tax=Bursaphelenchus okinawaensis TaxID=465554 RepID=A0A811K8I5_9BILA|nr:unnamed protein product [Bursaphelenchus okinawaensis]CAG9095656.1 unnamed protein product [Bursaphelenchus okinawaensis]
MKAAYLPECWSDDEEMRGLMSALKKRDVNPVNFDRTIEFWRRLIADYCRVEKKCVVHYEELRYKFRRGNQLPAPLLTVFEELHKKQVFVPVDELSSPRQGWLGWGSSLMAKSSWLMGVSVDFSKTKLVHMPTVKALAKKMLGYYKEQYEMVDCAEVVGYEEFKARCENIVDGESFDLVLDELMRQGEVSEGRSQDGDRILKFKDQGSQGPAKFTEADASVHNLRRTMTRLNTEIKRIEHKVKTFTNEAKELLKNGDKTGALIAMKKKKRAEKDLLDKDNQCQRLLQMMEQLTATKQTREIMDVYKMGSDAYKSALRRQGLSMDKIDETMDSIHEAIHEANDIDDALREGIKNMPSPSNVIDEASLEEELNELMREEEAPALPSMPEVPIHAPEKDELTARLKRLREGMPAV